MIVTCQNCDTSFQLDETRVPLKGIRVRCSRCKEAFFLPHPAATSDEAADEVASEVAAAGGPVSPGATQDLTSVNDVGSATSDEDEHDWEFNVDPNESVDVDSVPGLEASEPNEASGLSLEGEAESDDLVDEQAQQNDSDFGSVDDFSSLMEEDDLQSAAELGDEPQSEAVALETDVAIDAGHYGDAGASDDLGDPESWDFFGDEGTDGSEASAGGGAVLGRIELTSPGLDESMGSGEVLEQAADWDEDLYGPESAGGGKLTRILGIALSGVGWMVTIVVAGIGLSSGLWASAERLATTPQAETLGALRAESMRGYLLATAGGETLLEVRGQLVNTTDRPVQPEGLLEVSLLDVRGQLLGDDSALAGRPLSESILRESGPNDLEGNLHRSATDLATADVEPGQPMDFQAIFRDPPPEAARFSLRFEPMRIAAPIVDDAAVSPDASDPTARTLEADGVPAAPAATVDADELTWGE